VLEIKFVESLNDLHLASWRPLRKLFAPLRLFIL